MRLLTAGAIVAATGVVVAAPDVAEAAPAPLTPRFSATLNGDVQMTGNAILTCPATDAVCQQVLIDGSASGNGRNMQYIDVDGGGASPTFNSSSAGVTLAAGATVAYAGLYWAGTVQGGTPPPIPGPRTEVLLDTPATAGYTTVSGIELGSSTVNDDSYGAFADVTGLVTAGGNGTYTVANIQVNSGAGSTGTWSAWSLVVVYEDPAAPFRYVQVNDGYDEAFFAPLTFPVSGFLTPAVGPVNADIGVFVADGEPNTGGDSLSLDGTALSALPLNPADSFFNSTITRDGISIADRNPSDNYTLVADIDTVNADGVLSNGQTSTNVVIDTNEGLWPVMMWVSIDAEQLLDVTKSSDAVGGQVFTGDTVTYTVEIDNLGTTPLTGVSLADTLPPGVTYVPGSTVVNGDRADSVTEDFEGGAAGWTASGTCTTGDWIAADP